MSDSVVVLENRGVLPLDPASQRIALIGPTADDPLAPLCGYSFPAHLILNDAGESAAQVVTPRAAFEEAFGDRVACAQGCFIIEERRYGSPVFPGDVEEGTSLDQPSPVSTRTDLIPDAVECARAADVAVVCVGDLAGLFQTGTVGEGSDADHVFLAGHQLNQLRDGWGRFRTDVGQCQGRFLSSIAAFHQPLPQNWNGRSRLRAKNGQCLDVGRMRK